LERQCNGGHEAHNSEIPCRAFLNRRFASRE
jgi:hypothetical protein